MKRIINSIMASAIGGMVFLLPFLIGVFFLIKIIKTLDKWIKPVTISLGIRHYLGEFTIIVIIVLFVFFILFLVGIIIKSGKFKTRFPLLEHLANKIVPGYEMLKSKSSEIGNKSVEDPWQAIYLKAENYWRIAFIVEKPQGRFTSLYFPLSHKLENGEIRLVELANAEYIKLSMEQADHFLKKHGYGAAKLLNELKG